MPLTIATYNVLADAYIHQSYYPHVPAELLLPPRRHPALLAHIAQLADLGAQVICLQEVEPGLHQDLSRRLEAMGYRGIYAQKGAGRPDGCSTFFLSSIPLLSQRVLRYADGPPDSGHLALLVTLSHPAHLRPLTIANTHLRWEAESIPAAQRLAARELAELLSAPPPAPLILGGDFNLRPDSVVLDLVRAAGLQDSHSGSARAPTCFANGRASTVDYLWHSPDLHAAPLPLPHLGAEAPIPSLGQPSDHLPLLATFSARS